MSAETTHGQTAHAMSEPDTQVNVRDVFGLDIDMQVPAFSTGSAYVPAIDPDYSDPTDSNHHKDANYIGIHCTHLHYVAIGASTQGLLKFLSRVTLLFSPSRPQCNSAVDWILIFAP